MAKKSMVVKANRKPKFSSRKVRRCYKCGRPRAFMRDFNLCRICFREEALEGNLPGVKKKLMVNDPVADFLVRIANAGAAGKASVSIPFSNFKLAIAEKLQAVGYVKSLDKKGKKARKTLDITLMYDGAGKHRVSGVRRISKPGRRVYKGVHEIMRVRYGHGSLFLSTPRGIMTDKEARKEKVGGEALFEIW